MLLRTDLWEEDGEFVLEVELPGVVPEDVELSVNADKLCIRGRLPGSPLGGDRRQHRSERSRGAFAREIPFPLPVLRDTAEASMRDGLLCVRIVIRKDPPPPRCVAVDPENTRRSPATVTTLSSKNTRSGLGRVISLRTCAERAGVSSN